MEAHLKKNLPQEGTTKSGESLTEHSSVSPTYSGGDKVCSGPGSSLDLSGLAEAIPPTTVDTAVVSKWTTVNAHKRPRKKRGAKSATLPTQQGQEGQPERSGPNRRARRKALQPKKPNKPVAITS